MNASASIPIGRRIVCAAIRNRAGVVICGPRHFDSQMAQWVEFSRSEWGDAEQGFIDQRGEFLTREQAWKVASDAGQIIRRCGGDGSRLFSENLY